MGQYNKVVIECTERREDIFNKYIIIYSSSLPARGKIFYNKDGYVYCEHFLLEAGENIKFESYIDGMEDTNRPENRPNKAWGVYRIEIIPLQEGDANFRLHSLSVRDDGEYDRYLYAENERYKLAFDLKYGGGMCGLTDKKNIFGLGSLISDFSPSRYLQQSYLGTQESPYVCGNINGMKWQYNPVQCCDREENHSRLIDFYVKKNVVYIKAQPLDWAHNAKLTDSYTETTYTLNGEYIHCVNRFVDFSGFKHPPKAQELPPLYVISYLNRFVYYNGNAPWTDGKPMYKDNMPYWGNKKNINTCLIKLKPGNTETWCAWVSRRTDYGIGIYTPDVKYILAGRYDYTGSRKAGDDSVNYLAPVRNIRLESFVPLEYNSIITTGTVSEIKDVFYDCKNMRNEENFRKFEGWG